MSMKYHDTDPVTELDDQLIGESIRRELEEEEELFSVRLTISGADELRRTIEEANEKIHELIMLVNRIERLKLEAEAKI